MFDQAGNKGDGPQSTVVLTDGSWGSYDAHGIVLWYTSDDNVKLSGTVTYMTM